MYRQKQYGQSQILKCPFCGSMASSKNSQGIPVCKLHKDLNLGNMKCICGSLLELRTGKWGPYFFCDRCGNMNFRRVLELNPVKKPETVVRGERKEIVVRSDELDFL